jgi:hypothetical protein
MCRSMGPHYAMAANFAKLPDVLRQERAAPRRPAPGQPWPLVRSAGRAAPPPQPSYRFPVASRSLAGEATPSSNPALTGIFRTASRISALCRESIAFAYAPGREPHVEDDPLNLADGPRLVTVRGAADMEQQVLASGLEAFVLR